LGSCHTSCEDDEDEDDNPDKGKQNDLDVDMEVPWFPAAGHLEMTISRSEFKQVHDQLVIKIFPIKLLSKDINDYGSFSQIYKQNID